MDARGLRVIGAAVIVGVLAWLGSTPAAGEVTIDMPAAPPPVAATAHGVAAEVIGAEDEPVIDVGTVALRRYSRHRVAPRPRDPGPFSSWGWGLSAPAWPTWGWGGGSWGWGGGSWGWGCGSWAGWGWRGGSWGWGGISARYLGFRTGF